MYKKSVKLLFVAFVSLFLGSAFANPVQEAGTAVADTAITSQIKLLYTKDKLLSPFDVAVTTNESKVRLEGKVETDMQYEQAVTLAESVDGVQDVNSSDLKVSDSKQPVADTMITAKVKGKMLREKMFTDKEVPYWPVKIETKNGVVYLTGDVETQHEKENVLKIAKSIDGVTSVKNDIKIVPKQ